MEETKLLSEKERGDFNAVFPVLVEDLTGSPDLRDMPETNRWMKKVLEYNVPFGKQNRGLSLALAYRYLAKDLTRDNIQLSYVLGWCVEILQAFFLVADDIMDESETRRGRLCWYKVDSLGPTAFNDALLLDASIYPLLKKYFREKEYYVDLMEIFHEATFKTCYGQSLDTRTGLEKRIDTYTPDRYAAIVKYKTSYYSFYLPVSLAMAMAGVRDNTTKEQARSLLLEMGHFFQVQDDYLDCFGDTDTTGKIGTDIADCKCSWLVVAALQRASPVQRQIIMENYGQHDPAKIDTIKQLYVDMGIPELYADFEEENYSMINKHIEQMSPSLPKKLFRDMIDKLYRRSS
jgi:farnesyl diphosphate synthase